MKNLNSTAPDHITSRMTQQPDHLEQTDRLGQSDQTFQSSGLNRLTQIGQSVALNQTYQAQICKFDQLRLENILNTIKSLRAEISDLDIQLELQIATNQQSRHNLEAHQRNILAIYEQNLTQILELNTSLIRFTAINKWRKLPQVVKDLVDKEEAITVAQEACFFATFTYDGNKGAWSTYLVYCINQLIHRKLLVPYVPIVVPEWQKKWRQITPTVAWLDAPITQDRDTGDTLIDIIGLDDVNNRQLNVLVSAGQLLLIKMSQVLDGATNCADLAQKRLPYLLSYFFDETITTEQIAQALGQSNLGKTSEPDKMTGSNVRLMLKELSKNMIKPVLIQILATDFPELADIITTLNDASKMRQITTFLFDLNS